MYFIPEKTLSLCRWSGVIVLMLQHHMHKTALTEGQRTYTCNYIFHCLNVFIPENAFLLVFIMAVYAWFVPCILSKYLYQILSPLGRWYSAYASAFTRTILSWLENVIINQRFHLRTIV